MTSPEAELSPDTMGFMEFVAWSENIVRDNPDVRLLNETRLPKAFKDIRPEVVAAPPSVVTHRCDLADQWCEALGVPLKRSKTTLICEGVRHGLALIFGILARQRRRVAIPQDVYPVYRTIALNAGVQTLGIDTFPDFDFPSIFDQVRFADISVLLLPIPLKLQGRFWADRELAQVMRWLREKSYRRLILDGVYSFGSPLDMHAKLLLETEQVIHLNSLSKGWLHEQVFGAAMVPEDDFGLYAEAFRQLPAQQEKLFCAREMLTNYRHVPVTVVEKLRWKREALLSFAKKVGLKVRPIEQGYLVPIEASVSSLLANHRVLALPATAFGSRLSQWSVGSALSIMEEP